MDFTTDRILGAFSLLEAQIDAFTKPLERPIYSYLLAAFPQWTHWSTQFLAKVRSPYTSELPLMNPLHVATIVSCYLAVIVFGRIIMSKRLEKFEVRYFALAHNAVMTALSAFMCVEILRQAWIGGYSLFGNEFVDPAHGGRPMAKIVAVFYLSKILEFNDTVIMLLKKNFHQITFLHVYHHASVFVIWWLVTFWSPNGEAYFSSMLNSFIHVIMYGYCTLTNFTLHTNTFRLFIIPRIQTSGVCEKVRHFSADDSIRQHDGASNIRRIGRLL